MQEDNRKLTKISLQNISEETFIDPNDVMYVMQNFRIIRKMPNGQNCLYLKKDYIDTILKNLGVIKHGGKYHWDRKVKIENIFWTPHHYLQIE